MCRIYLLYQGINIRNLHNCHRFTKTKLISQCIKRTLFALKPAPRFSFFDFSCSLSYMSSVFHQTCAAAWGCRKRAAQSAAPGPPFCGRATTTSTSLWCTMSSFASLMSVSFLPQNVMPFALFFKRVRQGDQMHTLDLHLGSVPQSS